ncbi:nuclease-related domain-containing protein [Bacillus sp. Marseille-P3661]|uniref:nuclease-related domain-containing protein n=1 Tax=Bacillus sp. Marseille-P3661 TaxID=1936234 RepID=UPI000C81B113|nr:nuclease-related domain-containing protein [Bacillus sp. Marseille-P3661]
MAQLIKLHDFISRYETDIFRYPSQFIRLKQDRWRKIKAAINQVEGTSHYPTLKELENEFEGFEDYNDNWLEEDKKGFLSTIKNWFKRDKNIVEYDLDNSINAYTASDLTSPKTEKELKLTFLDELFEFQLNWASSTLKDRSFIDKSYYRDETLKYFLQHFPDNYLLMYKPTIIVKKAPVDLDIILISPVMTYCISLLESEEMGVLTTDRGRYWVEDQGESERKHVNPMLSLNRTANLVKSYYKHYNIDLPITNVVLSRTGFIEGEYEPINTLLVDRRNYNEWISKLKRLSSPLKFVQLKGAQALLKHCQSTYVRRNEWDDYDEIEYDEIENDRY